jgi:hypothetical protein
MISRRLFSFADVFIQPFFGLSFRDSLDLVTSMVSLLHPAASRLCPYPQVQLPKGDMIACSLALLRVLNLFSIFPIHILLYPSLSLPVLSATVKTMSHPNCTTTGNKDKKRVSEYKCWISVHKIDRISLYMGWFRQRML